VAGGRPAGFARGRPPFDGGPGEPGFDDGANRPPLHGRPEFLPPGAGLEMHSRPREIRITPEVSSLFDDTRTNSFYFAIWSRDRTLLKSSTNAPVDVPLPVRLSGATLTRTRTRDALREAYHYTELGDCVLA